MKTLRKVILLLTALFSTLPWPLYAESGPGPSPQQNEQVNLSGEWQIITGMDRPVDISAIGDRGLKMLITNARAIFIHKEENGSYQPKCEHGGTRDHYFDGQLQGTNLTGKMIVCTTVKKLVDDCHLDSVWETSFKAAVIKDWIIEGTSFGQGWGYDVKAGHWVNCHRDDRYSGNNPFRLWRDCWFSGKDWVNKYPTSKSLDDLAQPFRDRARRFIAALEAATSTTHPNKHPVKVEISATVRPVERSYLMHFAWQIAKNGLDPSKVPSYGIPICWVHRDANGIFDLPKSKAAAQEMVHGYKMGDDAYFDDQHMFQSWDQTFSRHNLSDAIDMTITWGEDFTITNADGTTATIHGSQDLHNIGAYNGVYYLASDQCHCHWSAHGN